jgi:O-antigen/teichoic acid export membrane protein
MSKNNTESLKERIIKDTAKYNSAQYASQFIGFFIAMAMRGFLGPYLMGIWSLLRIALDYSTLTALGVGEAVAFKIPFLKGKGRKKEQADVANSAFGFLFWASMLSAALIIIGAIIFRYRYPIEVISGLIVIAAYMILQRISSYYLVVLRANSNFFVINRLVIFDSIINLILVFLLVKTFKLYGLYVTVILLAALNCLFMHFLAGYRIVLKFDLKKIYPLIKFGIPLFLLGFLGTIFASIDRIMIAKMIGVVSVGYYSIAIMAKNYLVGATNNFGIVTIPRIMEAYGKEEKIEHIKKFVTVSAEAISYILPSFLGIIFLTVPLFISKVLPQFVPGIIAAQVLLLDIFFRSCCPQARQFLVALGKQARIIPIVVPAILLNIFLNYIFIKKGWGIGGVALGTSIASFFNFTLILFYAMAHFTDYRKILLFFLKIIFPLVYTAVVVVGCNYFISIENPYLKLSLNLTILFFASLPLFVYIDYKTHVLRMLFKFLSKRG